MTAPGILLEALKWRTTHLFIYVLHCMFYIFHFCLSGEEVRPLSFLNHLRPRALNNREQFLLLLHRHLKLIERRLEIAYAGVELRVADVLSGVGISHLAAVIMGRTAGGQREKLHQV